ncbi:unnamed protein product, partial [Mesorhabditis spiculigera]
MGPWVYTKDEMTLILPVDHWDPEGTTFKGNTEWEYLSLDGYVHLDDGYADGTSYYEIVFTLSLRRKYMYYVMVLILPCFICCTLCLFGLFIPSEATGLRYEKVNLGVSTLLAISMILQTVSAAMPKDKKLPRLGGA